MRQSPGIKPGDRVIVVAVPSDLRDDPRLKTRFLFERCVGRTFVVAGVDEVDGAHRWLVRLDVGEVNGRKPYMETIWIEPEYLRRADD